MRKDDVEVLEEKVKSLKNENNLVEALTNLEKLITIKSERFGKNSEEFKKTARDLCDICNSIALSFLETNQKENGLNFLLKAENLFVNYKDLIIICYNNIGCYYKFLNKYNLSMQYFEKSLKIAYKLDDKQKCAETHLNISSVLTNMGKYKLAIEQCLACIILIQEHIQSQINIEQDNKTNNNLVILILAYQNLAIQHEHLENYDQALLFYNLAEQLYNNVKQNRVHDLENLVDVNYKIKLIQKLQTCERIGDEIGDFMYQKYFLNMQYNTNLKLLYNDQTKINMTKQQLRNLNESQEKEESLK